MTADEAISGFQTLSRQWGKAYRWGELQEIWPELLKCAPAAMVRTVGVLVKNCRQLPSAKYVLSQVQHYDRHLGEPEAEQDPVGVADPEAEAREALAIMKAKASGEISREEYAARLYKLSSSTGRPGYAFEAKDAFSPKRCNE